YGSNLAADTLIKQLEAQAVQRRIKAEDQQQQAQDIWGKAIADALAGGGQTTPATLPGAPQPGQPSGAMRQATPGDRGGAPGAVGAGFSGPPAPSPARAVLQGQQPQPIQPQAAPFGAGFDPQSILSGIMKNNPNMPPGTLGMIVENHLLPMMDRQQQMQM